MWWWWLVPQSQSTWTLRRRTPGLASVAQPSETMARMDLDPVASRRPSPAATEASGSSWMRVGGTRRSAHAQHRSFRWGLACHLQRLSTLQWAATADAHACRGYWRPTLLGSWVRRWKGRTLLYNKKAVCRRSGGEAAPRVVRTARSGVQGPPSRVRAAPQCGLRCCKVLGMRWHQNGTHRAAGGWDVRGGHGSGSVMCVRQRRQR